LRLNIPVYIVIGLLTALTACGGSSSGVEQTPANNMSSENTGEESTSSPNAINIGLLLGFTGPVNPITTPMALAAETAMSEVSDSARFLNGTTVSSVRGDSTCVSTESADAAFDQLQLENVAGVVGASCSGTTAFVLENSAVPAGMVMISPAASSPALSTIEDNGLFFRTAPSDASQGILLSQIILDRGIQTASITYVNNAYGTTLEEAFKSEFEANGGAVTVSIAHEDGKEDYTTEANALSSAGGDVVVVIGYSDQGGGGIVEAATNLGLQNTYAFSDGMLGNPVTDTIASQGGSFGISPGLAAEDEGLKKFLQLADGFDASSPFAAESYDAAAIMLLAMQAANSSDPGTYKTNVVDVANSPGIKIFPGELAKALDLLAAGTEIDYVGATNLELIGPGESAGNYQELEIQDNKLVTIRVLGRQSNSN